MPCSNELILALRPFDLGPLAARLGVPFDPAKAYTEPEFRGQVEEPIINVLHGVLRSVSINLLSAHFSNCQTTSNRRDHLRVKTPAGPREFQPFAAYLYGDAGEVGDVWPENFVFGISLASRYFPIWLDWRDENGTAGDFFFDAETEAMIAEARVAIVAAIPEFAAAFIAVKQIFY